MRVLITGGAGFIGSNLARYLYESDRVDHIRVIDNLATGSLENLTGLDIEVLTESILDNKSLDVALDGMDSVVHLAAVPSVPRSLAMPMVSHEANATGTLAVLEGARAHGISHVIVASSSSVYGSNPKLPKSEADWTRPMSPYAASKLAAESYALAYQSSYGLRTLALRLFNVYGPGQAADHAYAAVVPKFLSAALEGKPLTVYGDGTQTRDFTFVRTVCSVIYEALLNRSSVPEPINLAFGTSTSLVELVSRLEGLLGHKLPVEHAPERPADVHASQADSTSLRHYFPNVQPTPLVEGLDATLAWVRASDRRDV